MKRSGPFAISLLLLLATGCTQPQKPDTPPPPVDIEHPDLWRPGCNIVQEREDRYVIQVRGSMALEQSEQYTARRLRGSLLREAVVLAIRSLIGSDRYEEQKSRLEHKVEQARDYIKNDRELARQVREYRLALSLEVTIDRMRLRRDVERSFDTPPVPMVVAIYGTTAVPREQLNLLGDHLSIELGRLGFRPKLFDLVRDRIALSQGIRGEELDRFLQGYLERPKADAGWEAVLAILQQQGRIVIGFNVYELQRTSGRRYAGMRVRAVDLFHDSSVGAKVDSASASLGDRPADIVETELLDSLGKKLAQEVAPEIFTHIQRENSSSDAGAAGATDNTVSLVFDGFTQEQEDRLLYMVRRRLDHNPELLPRRGNEPLEVKVRLQPRTTRLELREKLRELLRDSGMECELSRATSEGPLRITKKEE